MLQKDDAEHPVPEPLRSMFRHVASAFIAGDFQLRQLRIEGVKPISPETAKWIAENVATYGDSLAPLNDQTWGWSVYRWMDGNWQVAVDLTTGSEMVSDLTLHAKLDEGGDLEICGVYVS
jgi:hypothetical protein